MKEEYCIGKSKVVIYYQTNEKIKKQNLLMLYQVINELGKCLWEQKNGY